MFISIKQDFICARSVGPFGPPKEEKGAQYMLFPGMRIFPSSGTHFFRENSLFQLFQCFPPTYFLSFEEKGVILGGGIFFNPRVVRVLH